MKKAVISFGRMNPMTIGHQKLVDKIIEISTKEHGIPMLFLSHSQDKKKNPLSYDQKIKYAKKAFGKVVVKSPSKTLIEVMKELNKKGYDNVTLIVGSDRISEFSALLNKYNGKEFNYNDIKVISAGERDPDAEGVEGMSASKLRSLAMSGDQETFMKGLPNKLTKNDRQSLYKDIRGIMEEINEGYRVIAKTHSGEVFKSKLHPDKKSAQDHHWKISKNKNFKTVEMVKEEIELEEKTLSLQQRQKRRLTMKRLGPRIARIRKIKAKRMANKESLLKRARKAAILLIKKRIAGQRGGEYKTLSPSEKIAVDRMAEKRMTPSAIDRIAKKLYPKIMKKEIARLKSLRSGGNNG